MLVLANLVLSFIMEIYGNVSEDVIREFERRGNVASLRKKFIENPNFEVADVDRRASSHNTEVNDDLTNKLAEKMNEDGDLESKDFSEFVKVQENETDQQYEERVNELIKQVIRAAEQRAASEGVSHSALGIN